MRFYNCFQILTFTVKKWQSVFAHKEQKHSEWAKSFIIVKRVKKWIYDTKMTTNIGVAMKIGMTYDNTYFSGTSSF